MSRGSGHGKQARSLSQAFPLADLSRLSGILMAGGMWKMEKRPLILAVDDEEPIRRLLRANLSVAGFGVATASNGTTALVLLKEREPDLVLLDIMMPDLDGFHVLDLIRQDSNVPVIMLTAKGGVAPLRDALAQGADGYILKPFSFLQLTSRIKAMLRRTAQADG